jgi:CcmD family protein
VIAHAWNYVAAGYLITAGVLGGYTAWMFRRRRQLERVLSGERDG